MKSEREVDGKIESTDQKHIMRYQQLFAALAIRKKLDEGKKSGVIWHTQGSGKTALSYYLTYVLSDYYSSQNKVAKFYFIVDRLDLLEQATQEFEARGLEVKTANTRAELMEQFRNNQAQEGNSGKPEITVVNIQRFAEDKEKVKLSTYATYLQRIFIIDEAHRGYNPTGSFLANLFEADENAIKIALTGTPLLKEERTSWKIFGEYFHTYYYDKSIQDGYTLKIIREDIETSYRDKLSQIYEKLETLVQKKDIKKNQIIEHSIEINETVQRDIDTTIALLYKFWFVQYDFPNEKGRAYCQNDGEMEWNDSLKRNIPKGWTAITLEEISQIVTDSITPDPKIVYEHYSIPAYDDSKYPVFDQGSSIDSNKYIVPLNGILVSKLNSQR